MINSITNFSALKQLNEKNELYHLQWHDKDDRVQSVTGAASSILQVWDCLLGAGNVNSSSCYTSSVRVLYDELLSIVMPVGKDKYEELE